LEIIIEVGHSEVEDALHPSTICRSYGAGPGTITLSYPGGISLGFHRASRASVVNRRE